MTPKTKTKIRQAAKVDVYQLVTDRILEALEAGFVPWHKPWKTRTEGPLSLSTRKPYRGVNVFLLHWTAQSQGYASRWWGTYRQIAERGGQVRKGEKSTVVVFWKIIERKDGDKVVERIPLLRHFNVFNADQCDGELRVPEIEADPLADHEPIEICESLSTRYLATGNGPTLDHGGNRAFYSPARDAVRMPLLGQFETAEAYHATLFHELVHSTGHDSRLKRGLGAPGAFGDEDYSKEELVAEMGAAFLCGEAGIPVNYPQHAAYLRSWMRALRDDPKLLVGAAGAAQKAADLIVGRTFEDEKATDDGEES